MKRFVIAILLIFTTLTYSIGKPDTHTHINITALPNKLFAGEIHYSRIPV